MIPATFPALKYWLGCVPWQQIFNSSEMLTVRFSDEFGLETMITFRWTKEDNEPN